MDLPCTHQPVGKMKIKITTAGVIKIKREIAKKMEGDSIKELLDELAAKRESTQRSNFGGKEFNKYIARALVRYKYLLNFLPI